MAKCVCSLSSESGSSILGILRLSQASEDGSTIIEGELKGLSPGKHGITINVYGDLSDGAASCGAIFNPFGTGLRRTTRHDTTRVYQRNVLLCLTTLLVCLFYI